MFGLRCKNWKVCIFYSSQTKFCNQAKIFSFVPCCKASQNEVTITFICLNSPAKSKKIIKTKTFFSQELCEYLSFFKSLSYKTTCYIIFSISTIEPVCDEDCEPVDYHRRAARSEVCTDQSHQKLNQSSYFQLSPQNSSRA